MVKIKQPKPTPSSSGPSSSVYSFADRPGSSSPSSLLPGANPSAAIPLPAHEINLHGVSPLSHPAPTVRCPDCSKPILKAAIAQHAVNCQRVRDGLQPGGELTSTASAHRPDTSALSDNGHDDTHSQTTDGLGADLTTHKKRRLSDVSMSSSTPPPSAKKAKAHGSGSATAHDTPSFVPERPSPAPSGSEAGASSVGGKTGSSWGGDKDPLKREKAKVEKRLAKEKKESDRRTQKAAAEPIDLDRRCGVINDKNTPCLRSLTCKSHGMGPKRDVQGRSKPFDVLLLEWNRTNNPRWVEPKTRRKNQHDFGDDGGKRNGSGAGGSSGGGKKSSGKRDHHGGGSSSRRRGGRNGDDDSLDGGARSSPESELASLIAAAQASRSRLSAPTRGSSSSSSGSGLALSIGTSTYRAVGSAGGGVALAFGAGGGVPREGWKGSLFGRRRETLRALDRSFRDALGVK